MNDAARRRTLSLTLAYEGTAFAGWQRQLGARTVQAVVEDALAAIDERPVTLVAAGRTDAGVHARGQVASAGVATRLAPAVLVRALNVRLPDDVRVVAVADARPDFDARRAARAKVYRYHHRARPRPGALRPPGGLARPAASRRRGNGARGDDARGRTRLRGLSGSGGDVQTSVRRLLVSRVVDEPGTPHYLRYRVTGTGFLRHMVRNIVGTLVDIGKGRWPAEEMGAILASRTRRRAGVTAPAQGLVLERVIF